MRDSLTTDWFWRGVCDSFALLSAWRKCLVLLQAAVLMAAARLIVEDTPHVFADVVEAIRRGIQ